MATKKPNLYDLDFETLEKMVVAWGDRVYRAKQIWEWLYVHLVSDIEEMTSLSKKLRQKLHEETSFYIPQTLAQDLSLGGETRKDLLSLSDAEQVEVVLMHYTDRDSVCISSQVGCSVGCQFCATGQMGIQRNLSSGEIVAQVLHFARILREKNRSINNVVIMGMGEPFLNYAETMKAIRRLIDPRGFKLGQRRISISTAGIVPGIRRFAAEDLQVNLAVSLHAATDDLRSFLMPINRRFGLNDLFSAVEYYINQTNRRVTFEWVLINEVNDTSDQAEALAARVSGMLAHINLIPLNPTLGFEGQPSTPERITDFIHVLERRHVPYSLRVRRGLDINAGCGQLHRRSESTL